MKIKVTEKNYTQEVLRSKLPVFVEFFATWCAKCAMMADIVDELAAEYEGQVKVCQIDVDENEGLAAEFEIEIVPTFVKFRDGKPVAAANGVLDKWVLVKMIES